MGYTGNYVYNYAYLSGSKTDYAPLTASDDPNQFVTSVNDWNPAMQAISELRAAIISGSYFGFAAVSGGTNNQTPYGLSGSRNWIFLSSSGDFYVHRQGFGDAKLISGSAATTLSGAYAGGSAGPQVITTDSTRLGIEIDGPTSQSFALLTLKQGAGNTATGYFIQFLDSAGVSHGYMSNGGYLQLDAINGGQNMYADGAGATTYVGFLSSNSAASTGSAPVQSAGGVGWQGTVWDPTTLTSKTVAQYLLQMPVSTVGPYSELYFTDSITGGGGQKKTFTISGGPNTSAATGLAILNATGSSPTLYSSGALNMKSGIVNGTTPAMVWDTVNSFVNNNAYQWKNSGSHLFSIYPAGSTVTYFGFDSAVTKYFSYNANANSVDWGGLSVFRFLNNTPIEASVSTMTIRGGSADGLTATGSVIDTVNSFTTQATTVYNGASLLDINNAGARTFRFKPKSTLYFAGASLAPTIVGDTDIQWITLSNTYGTAIGFSNDYFGSHVYNVLDIVTGGTWRWTWDAAGHYRPAGDNTYDIGTSVNRVRNLYSVGTLFAYGLSGSYGSSFSLINQVANTGTAKTFIINSSGSLSATGAELVSFQVTGSEIASIRLRDSVQGANGWGLDIPGPGHITTATTNGSSATSLTIRAYNSLSSVGSQLVSFVNNTAQKAAINSEGYYVNYGTLPTVTVDTGQLGATATAVVSGTAEYGIIYMTPSNPVLIQNTSFMTLTLPIACPTGAICNIFPTNSASANLFGNNSVNGTYYAAQSGTTKFMFLNTKNGSGGLVSGSTVGLAYMIRMW